MASGIFESISSAEHETPKNFVSGHFGKTVEPNTDVPELSLSSNIYN